MPDSDKKDATIITNQALVDLGNKALKAQYLNLLQRVQLQEKLTSSEIKIMLDLKAIFSDQAKFDELESAALLPDPGALGSTDLSPGPARPITVSNLLRATEYLQAAGYAVKKSTLYNHKKSGLITPNAAGEYSTDVLDIYALSNLRRRDGAPVTVEDKRASRLQMERLEYTTRIAAEQARYLSNRNRDQEAEFKATIWTELAARATVLNNDLGNFYRSKTLEIINLVNGDPVKAPELVDFLLASLASVLARYTLSKTFHVQLENYNNLVESLSAIELSETDTKAEV